MISRARTTRTRKNRSRQRGTALMEALIVNMTLIVLLAGVSYIGSVFRAKIRSDSFTRGYAFAYALHGCQAAVSNESLGIEGDGPESSVDSSGSDAKKDLDDSGHPITTGGSKGAGKLEDNPTYTDVFSKNGVGSVSARSTLKTNAYSMLNIGAGGVTSSTHVQCNPIPEEGSDFKEVLIQGAKSFANW